MAFSIAICEDQPHEAAYLAGLLHTWAEQRRETLSLRQFPNAESFLFHYAEEATPDLVILDVEMGEMNGVTLAHRLREQNEDLQILFVTGFPDFISCGYDVAALHYLLKPVQEAKLFPVLDRALTAREQASRTVLLPGASGMLRLKLSDLCYAEAFLHTTELHTTTETHRLHLSISELEGLLGREAVRCHRSYLVLLRHIERISKTEVRLDTGTVLPVSRSAAQQVHSAFVTYYQEDMHETL